MAKRESTKSHELAERVTDAVMKAIDDSGVIERSRSYLPISSHIELRRDRRYAKARGDEVIVLETRGGGNKLHIVEAPPWLTTQDFGPIGVDWAKRAGWGE